jgi:mannose-6-phosphate isomerase-like protein (cupin superfamily)
MMSLYKKREVDFQYRDGRGSLVQLVHDGFAQINVLVSKTGASRGVHFHKRAKEVFYIVYGSVEVKLRSKKASETSMFKQGDFFEIPPFVLHDMFFPEDCLMVQMYDIPVENADGTKDIFMEEEFNA